MVEKREFTKWVMLVIGLMIVAGVVTTALSYAGIIGQTVVERKVFENSYQYSASQKAKINLFEAQLAEVNSRIGSPNLTETMRSNLEAQASSIRIQLSAARRSQ